MKGVVDSWVGYTGGESDSPSYASVCSGDGHTEALRIEYDPNITSYEEIIRRFYEDPHVANQFSTDGSIVPRDERQYQTAIWAQDENQREVALRIGDEVGKEVPVYLLGRFFEAEAYHQHYCDPLAFRKEPAGGARRTEPKPWAL